MGEMQPWLRLRPSLTPRQWDEIRDRLSGGATARQLALEYGVTTSTIRERFGGRHG